MTDSNELWRVAGARVEIPSEASARERDASLSELLIDAVAETTGDDPTNMQPLYEVIDPDALDRLFEPTESESRRSSFGRVSFCFNGCDVTIHADGRTIVSERDD